MGGDCIRLSRVALIGYVRVDWNIGGSMRNPSLPFIKSCWICLNWSNLSMSCWYFMQIKQVRVFVPVCMGV